MATTTPPDLKTRTPRLWWRDNRWFFFGLLLVVAVNFTLRLRLATTPLERDEGEYAYTGQLLLRGIPPYKLAYNMKFPGTYFAYAGLMAVCGETTEGIHVGIALVTSLTAILVGVLGRTLFGNCAGVLAAASQVLLAATPATFGLAGHATHFVALFTTAGALVLVQAGERPVLWRGILAGTCFGVAILMKQHAVLLAGAGLAWLGWWSWRQRASLSGTTRLKFLAAYGMGCVAPLLIIGMALAAAGVWPSFRFWTIQYAAQYASAASIKTAWPSFLNGFTPVFQAAWPLWILGLMGIGLIGARRDRFLATIGIVLLVGGMLAAVPGYHFRGHYFLAAVPGLAILIGATWESAWKRIQDRSGRMILGGMMLVAMAVSVGSNREIWFQLPPMRSRGGNTL
jgi:4-amino-4-deoxy-L-arabinose transferase-like glycosyltransferase